MIKLSIIINVHNTINQTISQVIETVKASKSTNVILKNL